MRKIINWIKSLFIKTDVTHPLNDAIVKLTNGKQFDFATDKCSVVNGYCIVKGVRQDLGITYVDLFVKIKNDEPKRFYRTEWGRRKFRKANMRYYIGKCELNNTLRLIGLKYFRVGNITLI